MSGNKFSSHRVALAVIVGVVLILNSTEAANAVLDDTQRTSLTAACFEEHGISAVLTGGCQPTLARYAWMNISSEPKKQRTAESGGYYRPVPVSVPPQPPRPGEVGDTLQDRRIRIAVLGTQNAATFNPILKPPPDATLLAVEVYLQCIDSNRCLLGDTRGLGSLRDSRGFEYAVEWLNRKRPVLDASMRELRAGEFIRGWVTFEVPKSATGIVFSYDRHRFSLTPKKPAEVREATLADGKMAMVTKALTSDLILMAKEELALYQRSGAFSGDWNVIRDGRDIVLSGELLSNVGKPKYEIKLSRQDVRGNTPETAGMRDVAQIYLWIPEWVFCRTTVVSPAQYDTPQCLAAPSLLK